MKKSLSYLLLIAAVVMSGLFTSCADESQLIGTWTDTDGETVQFKEGSDVVLSGIFKGTYIETSSTITLNILGDEIVWNILTLTDNQLIVTQTSEEYLYNPILDQYQWVPTTETLTFTKL